MRLSLTIGITNIYAYIFYCCSTENDALDKLKKKKKKMLFSSYNSFPFFFLGRYNLQDFMVCLVVGIE